MRKPYGMSGDLEAMSLADIVQTLSLGARTARVGVDTGSKTGELWMRQGALTHAVTGVLSGETAVFEMLSWQDGQFVIEYDVITEARSIEQESTYLVLEGLRRLDERGAAPAGVNDTPEDPPARGREARGERDRSRWLWTALIGVAAGAGAIVLAASGVLPWTVPDTAAMAESRTDEVVEDPSLSAPSPPDARKQSFPSPRTESSPSESAIDEADAAAPDGAEPAPADRAGPGRADVARPVEGAPVAEPPLVPIVPVELSPGFAGETAPALAVEPSEPAAPAASATLRIEGKTKVEDGGLTVFVDGAEVYSRPFGPGGSGETADANDDRFDVDVAVLPGTRDIVTRVDLGREQAVHENRLRAEFESGTSRTLKIVAGKRFGRAVSVKID